MLMVLVWLSVLVTNTTTVVKKCKDWFGQFLPEKYRKKYDAFKIATPVSIGLGVFVALRSDIGFTQAVVEYVTSKGIEMTYELPKDFHIPDVLFSGVAISQGSKFIYRVIRQFFNGRINLDKLKPEDPNVDPDPYDDKDKKYEQLKGQVERIASSNRLSSGDVDKTST